MSYAIATYACKEQKDPQNFNDGFSHSCEICGEVGYTFSCILHDHGACLFERWIPNPRWLGARKIDDCWVSKLQEDRFLTLVNGVGEILHASRG